MNNVIFHWLITINIYVKNICALFRVKCEEWVGCRRLYFLLADYTGVIFTLTDENKTDFQLDLRAELGIKALRI